MVLYVGNNTDSPKPPNNTLVCWNDNQKESGGKSVKPREKEKGNGYKLATEIAIPILAAYGIVVTIIMVILCKKNRKKSGPKGNLGSDNYSSVLGRMGQETNRTTPQGLE